MGNLKGDFKIRWSVGIIYVGMMLMLLLFLLICQYAKQFFAAYAFVVFVFSFLQLLGLGAIVLLIFILVFNIQTAGHYQFYDKGIVDKKNNQTYRYDEMDYYYFIGRTNKRATKLYFQTTDKKVNTLSALLPSEAFYLFQEGYSATWTPKLYEALMNGESVVFPLLEDSTSFKLSISEQNDSVTMTSEGIVLNNKFIKWEKIARYDVSFTGMVTIRSVSGKVIFLEPAIRMVNYGVFTNLLDVFIEEKEFSNEQNR